jgi:amino acid adenylation domain-containing protein
MAIGVEESSLLGRIRSWAVRDPGRLAFTFLADGEADERSATYGELDRRAGAVAASLQRIARPGERALLVCPPGLDYIAGFLGCLHAGIVAVPAYPPTGTRGLPRLRSILVDCEPACVLTAGALGATVVGQLEPGGAPGRLPWLDLGAGAATATPAAAGGQPAGDPGPREARRQHPEDIALLQYTSGSTSAPKGVMVSHGNLLANQRQIQEAFATDESSVIVSWLPLYHDMGLIGGLLHPLYLGARCILLSPLHFLQRPVRWLRAISRYRASVSGGPSFAYDLCARRITAAEAAGLDLEAWRVAFNGAEPVGADALDRFAAAFAGAGFRRRTFFPCYGLAEATLLVSGSRLEAAGAARAARAAPMMLTVDAGALAGGRVRKFRRPLKPRRLVGCGRVAAGLDLRLVDPATASECGPAAVGEIWVAGASVAGGYWRRPEESAATFGARLAGGEGPFLRTGDLGFRRGGELFVTGRIKDLILIRGRNIYPQDVEWTAARSHPALREGGGAAFAVETQEQERLAVVQEVHARAGARLDEVAAAVNLAVAEEHEVQVSVLVLVKPGTVPRTTSGKIRRRACRDLWLAGGLAPLGEWSEGAAAAGGGRAAPRTAVEARLARIWEEVLERAPGTVGMDDSFFALGGDSLRGCQLLARVHEAEGVEIPLAELFDAPTVARLAARIASAAPGGAGEVRAAAISPVDRTRPLPLTSPQRRLWFLDQLEPGSAAYNLAFAVRLRGHLDTAALAAALSRVALRHETLRSVFRVVGGAPAQLVLPASGTGVPLPLVDLAGLPAPRRADGAAELRWAAQGFALDRGPLVRARLVRLAGDEHELQLALHHIVADAWSIGVLLRELVALYAAAAARRPPVLPALPVQYGDFAAWQERRRDDPGIAFQLAAWRRRLGGGLPVLTLPGDRQRPPVRSDRGAQALQLLPAALADSLRDLAAAHGASLFMALLAGFQALLARHCAQRDLIVGTAIANRDRVELEGLIGLFVNTLPLRARLAGDPPFAELLGQARATVLEAFAGREVPFERLVDELQPERDLSRTPIVQVMLVLQNAPLTVAPPPGLELTVRELATATARFDLALSLTPAAEGLAAVWKYSRDLFDAVTVDRLAGHFAQLLAGATADPACRLAQLPLLSPAERHQVVREWNATATPYPERACLHELFAAQAERTPDAVAVSWEGGELSYRDLDRRANQLAHRLRRMGVGLETLVAVAIERSPELLVALVGVLKAGGAYLPLDPSYPRERLAFLMADARAPVLLAQERLRGRLPPGEARLLCLDSDWREVAAESDRRPAVAVQPENLAYVIHTSGSTGRPKGSMIPHRGIVNRLVWMQETYGLAPGEGVLQKTPVGFDVSVWELFWPLLTGARLVLARPGGQGDSAYLAALIAAQRVTTIHFVPAMLQVFLEEPRLAAAAGLKRVLASGEALPRELAERFYARFPAPGPELHNLYGPTEASVDVTAWDCARESGGPGRGVPIGRPIANLRIHLLDRHGTPVPVGVPGHLHIGGIGLARGYLRRPDLTAERFVPDPFDGQGARLYATGDLARFRPDGAIEFLGRLDDQVKIRGFRIELGEIEAVLDAHPAVRESVVAARDEGAGRRRLVAYLVGQGGAGAAMPAPAALRSWLAERLPEPMLPSAFVVLAALPQGPNGKVDRRALPAPAAGEGGGAVAGPGSGSDLAQVAPRTPVESRLAAMWSEQLGGAAGLRLGIHDTFFALGGDSIQGALLVNRLQRELGAVVYVMALFDHPTVARLAAHLEASYRDALLAAGWLAAVPDPSRDAAAVPAETCDAAAERADLAALERHLAARFSPAARLGATAGDRAVTPGAAAVDRRAIFVLSPFRSGSTLLRVMLAGHPRLFAPPELELLGFVTLGERRRTLADRDSFAREGLLRAVMELRGCDAETAACLVAEAEDRDEPTAAFYRRLQRWAGDRHLVDKTPRYVLDAPTLARAELWFREPLYLHLARHPLATIHSYLEARLDEVYRFPLPPRRQAELVWQLGHQHILDFLAAVPAPRHHRLQFEELVRDPRGVMEDLCRFLGLDFHPGLLTPYEGERMTGGIHPESRMMGDPKFLEHRRIEPRTADRWRSAPHGSRLGSLGAAAWHLAERLGYPPPALAPAAPPSRAGAPSDTAAAAPSDTAAAAPAPAPAAGGPVAGGGAGGGEVPLSFGQQRLWFLDRLEPGGSAYNMPAALRLQGALDLPALAAVCTEIERRHQVLRTIFPAVAGRPLGRVLDPRPRVSAAATAVAAVGAATAIGAAQAAAMLPIVDLAALAGPAGQAEADCLAAREADLPFELATGPLWRVRLLRIAGDEHLLLVNFHHIVCDGWSVGVLTAEMAALYAASRAGASGRAAPGLPEPVLQYSDYAAWQRRRLSGEVLQEHLRYWRERLAAPLPVLELPVDRPRPAIQTHRGARRALRLPPWLAAGLRELGRGLDATLYMVLVAAFQTLLQRITAQDDVLIGTPVANRDRAEIQSLVGPCMNTLVLRTDLSEDPAFGVLVQRAKQVCLGAARHAELPFEQLVLELGVARALDRSPLFSAMLALQNAPPPPLVLPGLTLERRELATRTAKFELTFDLAEGSSRGARGGEEGLGGAIEYNADLFDAATVARTAGHFITLLTAAAADPGSRLSALPLLAAAERHQLVAGANDTAAPFADQALVHELFAASARRAPEAVALSWRGQRVLYRELAARCGRLARRLERLGVGPEVLVGIYLERSPAMVVALLAVLTAGGAYLPLDPAWPPARVAAILADAGAAVLLSERRLAAALPAPGAARLVLLDQDAEPPAAGEAPAPPPRRATPANLAYVIYTSGSTGRPKGVELSHRGVVNYLASMARRPGLGETDVMIALTTLSFDVAVTELLLPLAVGARIELLGRETAGDPALLAAAIDAAGATVMQATPATWTLLLDAGWQGRRQLRALCGGEALPRTLAGRLLPRVGALWNVYGPTETTVWSTLHPAGPGDPAARQVPIGRPLANTTVHLLDRAWNLVPAGVVGELAIGGEGLARGYRARPELTADRFIPDPHGEPGARLYRSGDLARRLPDQSLACLGRVDHQVKVRGLRIEPAEIEAALAEHPGVRQCAVAAVPGRHPGDHRIVAWLVRSPGRPEISWDELCGFLRERLPPPMVPAAAVFLERLPLLPSGKVDRRSLPAPGRDRPDLAASYVSPRSERERQVARIWREVLELEQVGIHDNFFDLGGHSLLAAEVQGKLRDLLAAELPLVELFRHPTVHALARFLDRPGAEPGADGMAGPGVDGASLARERQAVQRRRQALARPRGSA